MRLAVRARSSIPRPLSALGVVPGAERPRAAIGLDLLFPTINLLGAGVRHCFHSASHWLIVVCIFYIDFCMHFCFFNFYGGRHRRPRLLVLAPSSPPRPCLPCPVLVASSSLPFPLVDCCMIFIHPLVQRAGQRHGFCIFVFSNFIWAIFFTFVALLSRFGGCCGAWPHC